MTAPGGDTLRITEIFRSIQGESTRVGLPTTFVRLTGCPLRCQYCDTAYAFSGGTLRPIDEIVREVQAQDAAQVTVTGGEPLAQADCHQLLTRLCDAGFNVSLETSGAIDVREVDARVLRVIDVKTPGSKEVDKNFWPNLTRCHAADQVKFVLCSREDYDWAKFKCDEYDLYQTAGEVLFSPSTGQLAIRTLADWILADKLPVRLQTQLHKIIWGDEPGR